MAWALGIHMTTWTKERQSSLSGPLGRNYSYDLLGQEFQLCSTSNWSYGTVPCGDQAASLLIALRKMLKTELFWRGF